ncbi:unnamed protein product [Brachionus calyciflorus]|uniref:Peptidase S1 domain-containing protein n=1 Tax=Brachionus calyciflorus TaxID=104777 RepID=A0A814JZQ4_9BILA|nr:unnamed protein product [Brachionus calyciflorus]
MTFFLFFIFVAPIKSLEVLNIKENITQTNITNSNKTNNYLNYNKTLFDLILPNNDEGKIINGIPAISGGYPFMVSLGLYGSAGYRPLCGASILSNQFVLTAAHCVKNFTNNYNMSSYFNKTGFRLTILSGIDNLSKVLPQTQIIYIRKVSIHPNFTQVTDASDMAILKTNTAILYNNRTQPIKFPASSTVSAVYGKRLTTLGWGMTQTGSISMALLTANMTVINNNDPLGQCGTYKTKFYCMKDLTTVQSNACFGDSGGPLVLKVNGSWVQYGIISFGTIGSNGICINTLPTFFTMVPTFMNWAKNQMTIL